MLAALLDQIDDSAQYCLHNFLDDCPTELRLCQRKRIGALPKKGQNGGSPDTSRDGDNAETCYNVAIFAAFS